MDGTNDMDDWDSDDGKASRWWKRQNIGIKAGIIVAGVLLALGAVAGLFVLFGTIVMRLWNWIMPYLFDLPTIDFWMAWGIVVLSAILFGRASSSGSSDSDCSKKRKKKMKSSMKTETPDVQGDSLDL